MALVSKPRPGFGTLGRPIKIYANHFIVDIPKTGTFCHYDVEMEIIHDVGAGGDASATAKPAGKKGPGKPPGGPRGDKGGEKPKKISKDLKRKAMKLFLAADPGGVLNGNKPVFDGEKNLYSMKEFKIAQRDSKSADIVVPKDADGNETKVKVTVQPCTPLRASWSSLQEVMEKKTNEMPLVLFQCINTVFREAALETGNKVAAGRSFFWRDKDMVATLGGGRECWPGFYSSARPCQWKLTLNLDVANTAFYEQQHVLDFLAKTLFMRQPPKTINDNQRRQFEREIKTLKVEVKHTGHARRIRVAGIAPGTARNQMFDHNGVKTSVANYFKSTYQANLAFPDLPLLEVGTKKSFMPMELCQLVGGQKVMKKLNEDQTSIMVKMCARPAPERKDRVNDIRQNIMNYDKSSALKEFNIKVEGTMKQIEGRVLPKPTMGQGHPTKKDPKQPNVAALEEISVKDMDGTWAQNIHYTTPKNLTNWVVIDLDQDQYLPLDFFLDELITTGRARGMNISKPEVDRSTQERNIVSTLKAKKDSYEKLGKPLDLALIIMRVRSPAYAEIKKAGDVVIALPTQVVLGRNIGKSGQKGKGPMNQLASNVLLKINAKLGGTHSQVVNLTRDKLFARFTGSPTIIFGADVTHPSPGEGTNKPSIAAVVASYNRYFTLYSARVRAQGHREEMMSTLKEMVIELLQEFKVRCGKEPQRIIFYRDGVSEGQYQQVMVEELRALQAACTALCPNGDYKPPITYIIVGKRHHSRLFPVDPREAVGKAQNVPPGTITDKAICHFSEFDWFLCSHFGIQGTSRPAHYNVLYDDSNYSADEIQMFSYYLTYCYARCARSVSIPAPAYYAHLAAFRARHHMEEAGDTYSAHSSGDGAPNIGEINKKIIVHSNMHSRMYFA